MRLKIRCDGESWKILQTKHYLRSDKLLSQITLLNALVVWVLAVLSEDGKFLLAAKRNRRTTYTEYILSVDRKNISRSSNGYVGKMRWSILLDYTFYLTSNYLSFGRCCLFGTDIVVPTGQIFLALNSLCMTLKHHTMLGALSRVSAGAAESPLGGFPPKYPLLATQLPGWTMS